MMRRVPSFAQSIVSGHGPTASLAVREFALCWERGSPVGAEDFLSGHAELAGTKNFALELAYEEYCQRTTAGELVDSVAYCHRFPDLRASLERLLVVHRYVQHHPELLDVSEPAWPAPDQAFQGFQLMGELGRGTFARVYLVRETALGDRQVALKISVDGQSEAKTLGRLSHEHIVPIHSVRRDEETGLSIICMPYRGTVTLEDVLRRLFAAERPPASDLVVRQSCGAEVLSAESIRVWRGSHVDVVVRLGERLAAALSHAHSQDVCHRDLKPSNVLLDSSGAPLLLDFNLSSDPRSAERRLGGTLAYMPPEQIRATLLERGGESAQPDPRSDIFSLGVILYELLGCASPFGPVAAGSPQASLTEAATELIRRQAAGPRPLRSLNPHVNSRLADLIESCLAVDPARRPATAGKLAAELQRANAPVVRARRWARVHRTLAAGAASLLLFAALAGGGWLLTREPYALRQLRAGQESLAARDFEGAVEEFSAAIDANPQDSTTWLNRGYAHLGLSRWPRAILDFDQAIVLEPELAEAYAAKGYAYFKGGNAAEAYAALREAVKLNQSPEIVNNFSVLHRLRQPLEINVAIELLSKEIEEHPELDVLKFNRVVCEVVRASMDRQPLAERCVTDILKVINGDTTRVLYRHMAACVYLETERLDRIARARDEIESAVARGFNPAPLRTLDDWRPLREVPDFEEWYASLLELANPNAPAEWLEFPDGLIDPLTVARR